MLYYFYTVLNTYGLLIASYHPEVKVYLDLVRNAHIKRGLQQIHLATCFEMTKQITFWDTGSYMISAAYVLSMGMNNTQDVILGRIDEIEDQVLTFKTDEGTTKDFKFSVYELGLGSWISIWNDVSIFGF